MTYSINELYVGIFYRFYNIWTKEPKKTIENFGYVLQGNLKNQFLIFESILKFWLLTEIEKSVLKNVSAIMNERIKLTRQVAQTIDNKEAIEFDII